MKAFKFISFSFALATLVACGEYPASNLSLPITSTSTNGVTKAIDMNPTQKLNIDSGFVIIDSDKNGVRDDIDELIRAKYTLPTDISAATQYAQAAQMGVASSSPAPLDVPIIFTALNSALDCAVAQMGLSGAATMIRHVSSATTNTKERLAANAKTKAAMVGQFSVITADPKTLCKK